MDIGAIFIGLAIAMVTAAYVAEPLIRTQRKLAPSQKPETNRKAEAEAEYRATLNAIRDLDFDFQTGKVLQADYGALREHYAARGAALLKELDQFRAAPRPASDDEWEAAIRARRKAQACPACGRAYKPGDKFCGKCGAAVEKA
jgi:hypothetical protein